MTKFHKARQIRPVSPLNLTPVYPKKDLPCNHLTREGRCTRPPISTLGPVRLSAPDWILQSRRGVVAGRDFRGSRCVGPARGRHRRRGLVCVARLHRRQRHKALRHAARAALARGRLTVADFRSSKRATQIRNNRVNDPALARLLKVDALAWRGIAKRYRADAL